MNIITLENSDRSLELSGYERDILMQVLIYLRDNFDNLEFSIRNFTLEEANVAIKIIKNLQEKSTSTLSKEQIDLLHDVTWESKNLIDSALLDEREDWWEFLDKWNDFLFDNLEIGKTFDGVFS